MAKAHPEYEELANAHPEYEELANAHPEYEELANAIVIQASQDYIRSSILHSIDKYDLRQVRMKKDCLSFFNGKWFGVLCKLEPKYLIESLDKEIKKMCEETKIKIRLRYKLDGVKVEELYSNVPKAVARIEELVKDEIDYTVSYTTT